MLTVDVKQHSNNSTDVLPFDKYSQTCLKGSPKGSLKIGWLRQVTFALYFDSRDPVKMAAKGR